MNSTCGEHDSSATRTSIQQRPRSDHELDRIFSIADALRMRPQIPVNEEPHKPPCVSKPCAPPDLAGTTFALQYRAALPIQSLLIESDDPDRSLGKIPEYSFGCAKLTLFTEGGIAFFLAVDQRFEQLWHFQQLLLGDLSSSMSLAPCEELTLEFESSQRTLLEQSTLDSTEQLLSEENTKVDKESVAATRSSSKTDNWRIDGSASISLGTFASASLQAGGSESVTDSAITSINQISEATQKSAKTLKTLHKIEVRGVTETSTQRRMKRTIKNPFADRTLSINVFAQLKRYSVETRLREFRPVLVFEARSLVFDETFIVANQDFLKNCLLDKSLVDALEIAASGANQTTTLQGAADLAERALDYLFGPDLGHPHVNGDVYGERGANVFNVDPIQNTPQTDANFPDTCFDAKLLKSTWNGIFSLEGAPYTGLSEAIGTDEKRALGLGEVYCALGYYRAIFRHEQDWLAEPRERTRLVQLALSIADQVGSTWEAFKAIGEGGLKSEANTYLWYVFNTDSYTEVFRRLPGFLSLVKGWLAPLVSATWEQEEQKKQVEAATAAVDRLLKHLQFHAGFYTRKYLSYLAGEAEGHAIVEFANKAIESTGRLGPSVPETLQSVFDANRAFVDGNQIIVPGMQPLNSEDMAKLAAVLPGSGTVPPELPPASVKPVVVELEIPSDGIHIEVAPGLCVLKGVWSEQVHKMLRVLFWASLAVAGGAFFLIASYIVYRLVALSR